MSKVIEGIALIAGAIVLGAITFGLASAGIGFSFIGILGTAAAIVGVTGIAFVLAGVAEALQHPIGTNIAIRAAASPWQIVYGRSRVGGVIVYMSLDSDQKYLNMVVVHAAHACYAVQNYWIDGRIIYFSGGAASGYDDGNTHYDPSGNKYNFHGTLYIENRLGTETGSAFTSLTGHDSNWPSTAHLQGHCCSYLRIKYDVNLWSQGYPSIKVDIAGRTDIYDPRNSSYGYSENAALCLNNVLCNTEYGLQCNYATEIDAPTLIAAANLCDELVPVAIGGNEARYTVNGAFDTSQTPGQILQSMLTSCVGRMVWSGGVWRIYPAAWLGASLLLGDNDLIGPIKWLPKRKYRDLYNGVRGVFISPNYPYLINGPGWNNNHHITGAFDGQWTQCDVPYYAQDPNHGYASDANLAADGNTRLWLDTRFPFTISVATAQRLCKILLLRNRQQGTGTIQVNLKGLAAEALDIVQLSHSRFSWTNKNLEVSNYRIQVQDGQNGSGPLIYCEMDLQETDISVYTWSTSEELGILDNPSPALPGQGLISQAAMFPVSMASLNSAIVGASPLRASDVGTSCDISVSAFQIQHGTGLVSYGSGTIHGAIYSARYYVYTLDAHLQGGAVTFLASLSFPDVVTQQGHVYIGSIVTPAAGATATTGGFGAGSGTIGGGTAGGSISIAVTGGPPITYTITWSTSGLGGDTVTVTGSPSSPGIALGDTFVSGATSGSANVSTYVGQCHSYSTGAIFSLKDVTTGAVLATVNQS